MNIMKILNKAFWVTNIPRFDIPLWGAMPRWLKITALGAKSGVWKWEEDCRKQA